MYLGVGSSPINCRFPGSESYPVFFYFIGNLLLRSTVSANRVGEPVRQKGTKPPELRFQKNFGKIFFVIDNSGASW